jgi:hypothetical protein
LADQGHCNDPLAKTIAQVVHPQLPHKPTMHHCYAAAYASLEITFTGWQSLCADVCSLPDYLITHHSGALQSFIVHSALRGAIQSVPARAATTVSRTMPQMQLTRADSTMLSQIIIQSINQIIT